MCDANWHAAFVNYSYMKGFDLTVLTYVHKLPMNST